ncbi:MAG: tetratricopeptide repeat protein, partial [Phycisphaerales bacterium]|nr:tetratricopeptide repeat protein [Phycisphaerales bacterium]
MIPIARFAACLLCIILIPGVPAAQNALLPQADPPVTTPDAERAAAAPTTRPAARRVADADRESVANEPTRLDRELTPMLQLIQQRQYGPARVRLRKYRILHPDSGEAAFLFGLTHHKEQNYEKALPFYQEAIRLAPHYQQTYYFLGWDLYYLGDLERASLAFEVFETFQPNEPDTQFALGLIASERDDLKNAEARFLRSIELLQDQPDMLRERAKAHARLGDIYVRQERLEEARTELSQAVVMWPDHYEAHFKLYRVLTMLGDDDAAEVALRQY